MPKNYTIIFTHPSGASATFIYENGELSAMAKGLDAEQFWTFKQVKAHLLRNEEDDIAISQQMMARDGFTSQVLRPLPDLLAPVEEARPVMIDDDDEEEPEIHYRRPLGTEATLYQQQTVDEIHWREGKVTPSVPPHRRPPVPVPERARAAATAPKVKEWQPAAEPVQPVDEIHWREGDTIPQAEE